MDIFDEVREGNIDALKDYIDNKGDVNATGSNGDTLLHRVADSKSNNVALARLLIDNGANVNVKTKIGLTPFHYAMTAGKVDVGKLLLEQNPKLLDAVSNNDYTPLHFAVTSNLATSNDIIETVGFLIDKGANIHAVSAHGFNPLHLAAGHNKIDLVYYLIDKGADIHAVTTTSKSTALHMAIKNYHPEVVRHLLSLGLDVQAVDEFGRTPLNLAEEQASTNKPENYAIIDLIKREINNQNF